MSKLRKKISLAGHWRQKGVTGSSGMTSKLLVHFLQAQGPIAPAGRWQWHTWGWSRGRWEQWPAVSPSAAAVSDQGFVPHQRALQAPHCPAHPQHHLHGALCTSFIFAQGEYAKAPVPKLTPQPISQTSFRFLHVSVPFWERDGATEQQIERVPKTDFLTGVPQFSGQRCDGLGYHLVYFLQHNGLAGLNSPWVSLFVGIPQELLPKECQTSTAGRSHAHGTAPQSLQLPRLWDSSTIAADKLELYQGW